MTRRVRFIRWTIVTLLAMTTGSYTASGQAGEPLRLRVLSYNIHHGEGIDGRLDLERTAGVIRSVDPDIVALQEVEQNTRRTQNVDQTAELGRLTSMKGVFAKNIDFQGGGYGNAVLSRFSMKSSRNVTLPRHKDGEQRGALFVELEVPGRSDVLTFISTHLDNRADDGERLASAERIHEELKLSGIQLAILAGDLNASPESAVLRAFRDHWTTASSQQQPTFPVAQPTRQIDFVMCRPLKRWKIVETRVLEEAVASDHRAIFSVLELK